MADEPIPAKKIISVLGLPDAKTLDEYLGQLRHRYESDDTPFTVRELAGGYQLLTLERYYPWLARHFKAGDPLKLSQTLLETVAIVAYRQPITRAEIDLLRGSQSQEILNQLMERGLVRVTGKHDSLGRPALYGTTRQFLQVFGLKSIEALPVIG